VVCLSQKGVICVFSLLLVEHVNRLRVGPECVYSLLSLFISFYYLSRLLSVVLHLALPSHAMNVYNS
jgi:hypothetical protein